MACVKMQEPLAFWIEEPRREAFQQAVCEFQDHQEHFQCLMRGTQ